MQKAWQAAAIDELLRHYHMYGWFNGSALVAEKGDVIYAKGLGWADMEWDIANTLETKFRVGSVTKQFTSMLIMQLVDEGKVCTDDTIYDHLPYYRQDTGSRITVHQMLNHTSGLPNYTALPQFRDAIRRAYPVEGFVKEFCSGDLEFEPGTEYSYCNSGYFILGAIIEKVLGCSYEAALRQRVLDPLGMSGTGYDWPGTVLAHRARGYDPNLEGYTNTGFLDMSLPYAAGSMYSTVLDLHKWDRALYGEGLLSAESKTRMWTPGLSNYGYGWIVVRLRPENLDRIAETQTLQSDHDGTLIITHGGNINGFTALICRLVETEQVIILLVNLSGTIIETMARDLTKILLGQPYELPKQPAAPLLYHQAVADGVAAALATYGRWRNEAQGPGAGRYDTAARELLRLARHLAGRARLPDAEAVCRAATEYFPKSEMAFVELAGHQLAQGKAADAVASFERALVARPDLPSWTRRRIDEMIARAQGR